MAGAYSYPVLVDLGEKSHPKLKNKLVIYFQSKKSHGGDCEVEYESGSSTALLRFRRKEDQENVLAKETHQIPLDDGVLKMKVCLPPNQKAAKETPLENVNKRAEEAAAFDRPTTYDRIRRDSAKLRSTSAVLEKIPDNTSQEFLEMLVENVLRDYSSSFTSQNFSLDLIHERSFAVVTFESGKENFEFVTRCPQNRMFLKKNLAVRSLEVTKQVIVDDIEMLNEDILHLYFDRNGGVVENVSINEEQQSAIITFKEPEGVQNVLSRKHNFKDKEIKVYPFYESLGVALYGKDKPPLRLPATIAETIDSAVFTYLQNNPARLDIIRADLEKHFCNVHLDQSTVRLRAVPSLLKQSDVKSIVKEWSATVKSAFRESVSEFKSLQFHLEKETWGETEKTIRQRLQEEPVVLVADKVSGVIAVAGLVGDVDALEGPITQAMNSIAQRAQREKLSKTQEIKVSPSIYRVLSQSGFEDKLLSVHPELTLAYEQDTMVLRVTGLVEEIFDTSKVIQDANFSLRRQNLDVDDYVLELLKSGEEEELTATFFTTHGINAALEIGPNRVQLVAASENDLSSAQEKLKQLLDTQYIDVEDVKVLEKPEWKRLVSDLEGKYSVAHNRTQIHDDQQVVVCGPKENVLKVSTELKNFLYKHADVKEAIQLPANVIIEYLQSPELPWLKDLNDKVHVSFQKNTIVMKGCREDVEDSKVLIEGLASSLVFESFKVSQPGGKKFFQDKKHILFPSLKNQTGCVIQLIEEHDVRPNAPAPKLAQKPVYQIQTQDGVDIAVSKADMCSYPLDAIINASTPDLRHDSGLSKAIYRAAGPELQDECDNVRLNQTLRPGDAFITKAGGQLRCKHVVHAVGPNFDANASHKSVARLKKAVKESLGLAVENGCLSVAVPAISRNQGFPPDLCALTIVKAAKEYCDENYDQYCLKEIHFVDTDGNVVQAMEVAVKQVFGSHGISQSQESTPPKLVKFTLKKPVASDPYLYHVQTKEGLDVTLTKGNIEAAKTEVTVNTVFDDLNLSRGAVSKAISTVAGPKLQQLVKEQKETVTVGEVIVTEGCKLKSKQVFHAVAPRWDNDQGTAEKLLNGIFKDCLEKAEHGHLASISIPAIGTGNLGFPKARVASGMLNKIVEFSQAQPKHLKKVVIVLYPGDAETIKEFSSEFMKKFPNASAGQGGKASSQTSGGPFSQILSSQGMHETKMGNVTIQVVNGDITKEATDVIVNSSNDAFSLKSGVSKAILEAAGQAVEQECQNLGPKAQSDMIMTQPGNLKCKKILHIVGQTDPVKIQKVVKDALDMCGKHSLTSVSFPAIGTGQGNVKAGQVADAMLDAVIDVLHQTTSSSLKTVRIVIFQKPMLQDFHNSLKQREGQAADDQEKNEKPGIFSRLKSLIVGDKSPAQQKDEKIAIHTADVKPAHFHICGGTSSKVEEAKKHLIELITNEQAQVHITDNAIQEFSDADFQHITDIQNEMNVTIRSETSNSEASLVIEGLSMDVLRASQKINNMLKKVKEKQEFEKKVELANTVANWQYLEGQQFKSFDEVTNYHLEEALQRSVKSVQVKFQGQDFKVTMPNGPASDQSGRTLEIKRIDKLKDEDIPENWDPMPPNATCLSVQVQAGTPEYTNVQKKFQASCNRSIVKIQRIQNPALLKGLLIKKKELETRNNHANNERLLFHGTSEDTVKIINERGFNRVYAGKNAACYGNGTYFAVNASYSASDTYSRPNANREKFMYLCRVLTGDYALGQQNLIAPPHKQAGSVHLYDSVVDNLANPSMFVIFHDVQAYPEYLIVFK